MNLSLFQLLLYLSWTVLLATSLPITNSPLTLLLPDSSDNSPPPGASANDISSLILDGTASTKPIRRIPRPRPCPIGPGPNRNSHPVPLKRRRPRPQGVVPVKPIEFPITPHINVEPSVIAKWWNKMIGKKIEIPELEPFVFPTPPPLRAWEAAANEAKNKEKKTIFQRFWDWLKTYFPCLKGKHDYRVYGENGYWTNQKSADVEEYFPYYLRPDYYKADRIYYGLTDTEESDEEPSA